MAIVWQNECRLVFWGEVFTVTGEMGLCYPGKTDAENGEVQVSIRMRNVPQIVEQLMNVPVRVTIERVPGGNP